MLAEYRLLVYDTSHVLKYRLTDFGRLRYAIYVNKPGVLEFVLRGDHATLDDIADNWELELQRRLPGQSWATEVVARWRDGKWSYEAGRGPQFEGVATGIKALLGGRIVNWYAGTANRSYFDNLAGETIMKTLVYYNAGPGATTGNGRINDGQTSGLTVANDTFSGSSIDLYCFGKNLLETLQKVAPQVGLDFDLVKTGAGAYEFRTYVGQLGTDRSSSLVFAMGRGNMAEPVYTVKRAHEKTTACTWGQGEGSDREYVTEVGPDHSAIRDYEFYVDARHVPLGETMSLVTAAKHALEENRATESFSFQAVQVESCRYGEHYFLGDKVTAVNPFNGATAVLKVQAVEIVLGEKGSETISVEIATP